jgi:hypothetical protein
MPLQLIRDGRLAEMIGKATTFGPPIRLRYGDSPPSGLRDVAAVTSSRLPSCN